MSKYKTEQENFWTGEFGDLYIDRNQSEKIISGNASLFAEILSHTENIETVLELGANIGLNLRALNFLRSNLKITAVEINQKAAESLREIENVNVIEDSIINFETADKFDLVFTKTVLIHIDPESLTDIYRQIHKFSNRYICLIEYYNPTPIEIQYRGHREKLFKRDFAGEMLKMFDDLRLISYGFRYHGDNNFPQDDVNWFLLERRDCK
jgi:pseudaminic acid biosynthesis-associated methylase